ncbi:hypothetical protein [Myroides odoratus]|uniref:Uncharacterized protein n=1 Tax=Myroides odoratus TaxID=256 RepID=A0A9Q6Z352_MYROD|nr:hypothetical protein [Myroides odoratus]EHQ42901.1 hypothetical protein Myrod_2071 [Myroides odoratus DSM 2801]EKB07479.1 hypothetical protein HMPREF9716_01929 [Myroides odoratus CIP 103059]QQU00248.1 hypothetical protein I6I88_00280 [Myroides odoratus]WQD57524.1 hypothetical protein U0010_18755 [Myroides odoratus]STZ30166.1 Uncharacterised protein [Myroides odoratus]
METKLLLPHSYKKIGWIFIGISVLIWIYALILGQGGILFGDLPFLNLHAFAIVGTQLFKGETSYFSIIEVNLTTTLMGSLFLVGGLLIAFSKEKIENEVIAKLRSQAFQWSFLVNYVLLLFLFLFIYGAEFYYVMVYNMFAMLILFICRFNYLLYLNKK